MKSLQYACIKLGLHVCWLTCCCHAGLYQSLTAGWRVSRQDVDDAVNNVCEELAPIEIDITNFILSSCRLTHHMLDIGALWHTLQHSDSTSRSPSTVLSSCDDEQNTEQSSNKSERFAWHIVASIREVSLSPRFVCPSSVYSAVFVWIRRVRTSRWFSLVNLSTQVCKVCLHVCMRTCITQKLHIQTSRNFLYIYITCGHGSILLWQQSNTLCTYSSVYDVTFSDSEAYTDN